MGAKDVGASEGSWHKANAQIRNSSENCRFARLPCARKGCVERCGAGFGGKLAQGKCANQQFFEELLICTFALWQLPSEAPTSLYTPFSGTRQTRKSAVLRRIADLRICFVPASLRPPPSPRIASTHRDVASTSFPWDWSCRLRKKGSTTKQV